MLINAAEYVTIMDEPQFLENEAGIKELLEDLSQDYIFNDLGFDPKNAYNLGYRPIINENGEPDGEIVIADYGYLYPIAGQESALACPRCKHRLKYNATFTKFVCPDCSSKYDIMDIQRRMKPFLEDIENEAIASLVDAKLPRIFVPRH